MATSSNNNKTQRANLKRLEKAVSADPDDNGNSNNDTVGSFHKVKKALLNPQEARKMVSLASQRLQGQALEELYGVTLQDVAIPSIPSKKHAQLKLGSLLGHGQFHAVYEVENGNGSSANSNSTPQSAQRRRPQTQDQVVVKTLRPQLRQSAQQLSNGAADLVKEGLILQTLTKHANIISLKGLSASSSNAGISGFLTGQHDGYFLVLEQLSTTLQDKLKQGGDWRDEDLFLQERLGNDGYDYGYYYYHKEVEPEQSKSSSSKKESSSTFGWLFSGSSSSNSSPSVPKAIVEKQHSFFLTRLQKCIDMADALAYMHDRRILHRDLKPGNIGFIHHRVKQTLKVFDMDMSRVIPRNANGEDEDDPNEDIYPQLTLQVGSRRYIAPEIARSEAYNLKSDVYAFGLLIWEMLSLRPKPYAEFEAALEEDHCHNGIFFDGDDTLDRAILFEGRLRPTLPRAQWSEDLCDLIAKCWHHDMYIRPTMREALEELRAIHTKLSSSDKGMIPATSKNEVCYMNEKDAENDTATTAGSSSAADGAPAKSLYDSEEFSITAAARYTAPTMKKSQSWCQLMTLGMGGSEVDSEEDDNDEDEIATVDEEVEENTEEAIAKRRELANMQAQYIAMFC